MTGNTVLLAIAVALGRGDAAVRSGVALACFSVGAALGSLIERARTGFVVESVALAATAAFATATAHLPAVATAASAMGLQTATLRLRNETGIKVTYLTGTVTALFGRLIRAEGEAGFPVAVWLAYALGGVAGASIQRQWGSAAFLPAAAVAALAAIRAAGSVTPILPMRRGTARR
jgi:uncharacterized membrane protein YoaK (UPF0700 family)